MVSNDPANPDVVVPVGLDLIGTPDIAASAAMLDFGGVYITAQGLLDLTVMNNGCADLTVSDLVFDHGDFSSVATTPIVLPAGASQVVSVAYTPTTAGPAAGTLTIVSDDADTPMLVVALAGIGLDFPDIAVAPTSLSETLGSGGTSTQTLTITNNGLGDLNFTIPEAEYIAAAKLKLEPGKYAEPIDLGKDAVGSARGRPRGPGHRRAGRLRLQVEGQRRAGWPELQLDRDRRHRHADRVQRRRPEPGAVPHRLRLPVLRHRLRDLPGLQQRLDQLHQHEHGLHQLPAAQRQRALRPAGGFP